MPRYASTKTFVNRLEAYEFLRKERNNVKGIKQFQTVKIHNPGISVRSRLETVRHVWTFGDRYYNLAQQYYGDPNYWWVIAWYNGRPTEADVSPGDIITIPVDLENALAAVRSY
jgi:nucleoid-associated protein YgaU|tara:strand:- start:647 stop:988 length:342 start_codon:yes stop_codon:yes gene_type:complete